MQKKQVTVCSLLVPDTKGKYGTIGKFRIALHLMIRIKFSRRIPALVHSSEMCVIGEEVISFNEFLYSGTQKAIPSSIHP